MVSIAICDDCEIALAEIKQIVEDEFRELKIEAQIQIFTSGQSLVKQHKQELFDVVFLDISMPEMDGFEAAEEIKGFYNKTFIIFISALSELVYQSFDFQPFNFLPKYNGEPLQCSIPRVIGKLAVYFRQNKIIELHGTGTGEPVCAFYYDIMYIESDKHYIKYFIKDRPAPVRVRGTFSNKEAELSEYDFIKLHKRYAANPRHIKFIDIKNGEVCLSDGNRITMSRSMGTSAREKYITYVKRF